MRNHDSSVSPSGRGNFGRMGSVSYTHLDVYKRQPMDCRSGAQQPNPAEPMTAASKKPGKSLSLIHI